MSAIRCSLGAHLAFDAQGAAVANLPQRLDEPGDVHLGPAQRHLLAPLARCGPGPFLIQGRAGFVMPHRDPSPVDHVELIEDEAAVAMTRRLAREEGVFPGISTGANVVGAHRLAGRLGPQAVVVTLAGDTGSSP